ncbi:Trm112 family protein [Blochmannia endosymbiont of Camponotus nipponensis]|uniref:Trm112 family protein n=1 Tax=Blochmannia endosymbiont of Camponotus nipponensis TaxID=2681986 RepID=UPI00135890EA|nr:Trm112 family protein [Blochmannia endosymbiont of Camponotus nipponensis]
MKYQLLKIIVCPICYSKLFFDSKKKELICNVDNVAFPIKNGIPVLLKKDARNFTL